MDVSPQQATLFIINPLSGRKVQAANWFRTHPPTEDRIARLRAKDWAALGQTSQNAGVTLNIRASSVSFRADHADHWDHGVAGQSR